FKETLGRGLKLLEEEEYKLRSRKGVEDRKTKPPLVMFGLKPDPERSKLILSGEVAFKLYDTYGFPLDLTQDLLKARGIGVDVEGFEKCMEGQRDMARAAHKGSGDT